MNVLDELKLLLQQKAATWTPADRDTVLRIGQLWMALAARQAAGENVDTDLEHAKSAASSVQAAGSVDGAAIISEWLDRVAAVARRFLLGIG